MRYRVASVRVWMKLGFSDAEYRRGDPLQPTPYDRRRTQDRLHHLRSVANGRLHGGAGEYLDRPVHRAPHPQYAGA